ncbi:hypothetical protein TSUD_196710 [Trifolium subterraneum]|uniref:F-box domain-containing protein n=1 Tax=Trifolium subterraneum TaxID=3900 RepID=A0A2Z6NCS4_TRISU|nr:hypothetical protein TSUD_196710 [Trifolium subterraneum]
MKRNNRSSGRNLTEYPIGLIIQILLRLPVKSLVRFKRVCKSWFSLISDPHFANSHFQLSAATPTRRLLLLSNKAPHLKTRSIDFESSLNHVYAFASPNLKCFSPLYPYNQFSIRIRSSCRGFIFFDCSSSLCIWNPSTGIHKQIPFSTFDSKSKDANTYCYMYGFGYDESKDDYLVVSMSCDSLDNIWHLEFFSLRANTWKEIEGTHFPYIILSGVVPRVGTLFGGAIHWLAFRRDLESTVIVAFDLMERELVEMSFPDYIDIELTNYDLWVFGEFLALWVMDENDRVEIWVMKEYKVCLSWTKMSFHVISTEFFSPICCTKSGDIIGTDGHAELVKYDDKGQLIEHYSYNNRGGCQLAMYTESLLSLPGGDSEQA